jgi:hypothetical protein
MRLKHRVKRWAETIGVLGELRATVRFVKQTPWFVFGLVLKEVLRFDGTYNRLMVAPGKNPVVALRSKSPFLSVLCSAYRFYAEKKMEASSRTNEEFQRKYWSGFRAYYVSKAQEDYSNDFYRTFDEYFCRALATHSIRRCLDVGCGGFTHILRLRANYPEIEFVGIDLSRVAQEIWDKAIRPFHDRISFVPGSIAQETEILRKIDLFYSFGSLMYLSPSELEAYFSHLTLVPKPIVGIVVEPDDSHEAHPAAVPRHAFFHNYLEYFRRFEFRVFDYVRRSHHIEAGLPVLFAYFSTK